MENLTIQNSENLLAAKASTQPLNDFPVDQLPLGLRDSLSGVAPEARVPALFSALPIAAAYADGVKAKYCDGSETPMALMSIIIGEQASGKGVCRRIESIWAKKMDKDDEKPREEEANILKAVSLLERSHGVMELPRMCEEFCQWLEAKRQLALANADRVMDVYRRRSAVIGFRCGVIFHILEQTEEETDACIRLPRLWPTTCSPCRWRCLACASTSNSRTTRQSLSINPVTPCSSPNSRSSSPSLMPAVSVATEPVVKPSVR